VSTCFYLNQVTLLKCVAKMHRKPLRCNHLRNTEKVIKGLLCGPGGPVILVP
jgi:hypothetical protein